MSLKFFIFYFFPIGKHHGIFSPLCQEFLLHHPLILLILLPNSHPCFILISDIKELFADILSKTKLEAPVICSHITLHFDF